MVNYYVERLYITMHDTVLVRILESLEDHVGVQPDIHIIKATSQHLCLYVRDILEDESWSFSGWITQNVVQFDDIRSTVERLQYFDLSVLFLDSDRLQNFNDALLVVLKICTCEDLGIFTTTQLVVYVIIID